MVEQIQGLDLHGLANRVLAEARAAWRYRWYGLAVAWGLFIVGALLVFSLPNKYQASTEVYADTDALMNPLLKGISVQPDVRNRLEVVTHTLISRPNLETVAHQTGLSVEATTPESTQRQLQKLASSIDIESAGTRDLYTISYENRSRVMAKKVVEALLQVLMNDTLGGNVQSTQTAQRFLQQQVAGYSKKLDKQEAQLAAYKKANVGFIPSEGGSDYITRLQSAEQKLQDLENQRSTVVAVRSDLERQMRGMATNSDSSAIDPRVADIDSQITTDQAKLHSLLLKYTDKYPDVVSLKRMIAQLRSQRAQLAKGAGTSSVMEVASGNPVYQDMQKALYKNQLEIDTLTNQISQQRRQVSTLKHNVDRLTDVQAKLQRLTRNYDITKKRYNELLSRLDTAQISQDASHSGNNLRFQVISPPIEPIVPASPNRIVLLMLVLAMALGGGGGFAFVMHKMKPVIVSLKGLKDLGDFPVLGAVSLVMSPGRRQLWTREVAGFVGGVVLLVGMAGLGLILSGAITDVVQHVIVVGGS